LKCKRVFLLLALLGVAPVSSCMSADPPTNPNANFSIDYNLGFEEVSTDFHPLYWYAGGSESVGNYSGIADGKVFHSGKYSLQLKYIGGPGFGVATNQLRVADYRGKTITYSGWIKTKDVTGFAGLWMRVDGPDSSALEFNNMYDSAFAGTQDWKQFSYQLPVADSAIRIYFGALLSGPGEAWFDDLSIK
jgi:hypothetical protein